uniref:Protein quiver n=1 Tax=Setaria digitata TaxID=48799 RepID=A0A915PHD5_9BILA
MRCYQCNSAKDPNCDSRDAKDLRQYVKICQMLEGGTYIGNEPIACRKIVQSVEDLPVQTIRECAYTGDKDLNGLRKQGNKAIKLLYYQCENVDGKTSLTSIYGLLRLNQSFERKQKEQEANNISQLPATGMKARGVSRLGFL